MKRKFLENFISETFDISPEFPWLKYPGFAVYRHSINRKWFAVIMEISKDKIGIKEEGTVNVVNLKCDPVLIGSLINDNGIHRGYHMNKNYWITVRLDGSVDEEKIKWLIGISYELTLSKKSNNKAEKRSF